MNKSDIKLILSIFITVIILLVIKNVLLKKGDNAFVYYENKVILKIDLNKNDTYTVNGFNGDVVIEVKDKKIRVKEESSPLHICSKQGWIDDATPIVCLPNKIIVQIETNNEEIDTIIS